MIHYIIDTNFVHLDFFLRGTNITALTGSSDKLVHNIYMPHVVFDELCNQYREEIDAAAEAERKYHKILNRVNPVFEKHESADWDNLKATYEQILAKRCCDLDICIIKYPQVEHQYLVKRELDKRKPFKDSTKGYRDSLIWETVIALAKKIKKDDCIVFLSENTNDFAKDKSLHPDLKFDCEKNNIADGKIQLESSFHSFITNEILPAAAQIQDKFQELLRYNAVGNIDIHEILNKYLENDSLQHLFEYNPEVGPTPYAPDVYEHIMIHYRAPFDMNNYDVRRISEQDVLISVQVEFDLFMDCLIYKSDLYLIDDESMPDIFDKNWNEHYVAASDRARMMIQYNILTDVYFKQLQNVDEQVLRVEYQTGFRYSS